MTDLLGPASATNAVTTRKTDGRSFPTGDTWFKPCTTAAAQDGTQIQADFLNGLLAQLRAAIRGNGKLADGVTPVIAENNASDAMLLGAIQALIQRGQTTFGLDTGTTDALVIAPSPAVTEYKAGMRFFVQKNPLVGANTTTAPTIAVSGLAALTITKADASALGVGDLKKAVAFEFEADGAGNARLVSLTTPGEIGFIIGADTGAAGAIAVTAPIPSVTALRVGMTLVTVPSALNTGPTTINLAGLGTKPVIYPNGSPFLGGETQPRPQVFIYDGANWEWQGQQSPVLQQTTSFYVNGSTSSVTSNGITYAPGSDTNNGLTPATPFKTIQKAANFVSGVNLNGQGVTVNVADGTYAPFTYSGAVNGAVTFIGDPATPSNCTVSTSSASACVSALNGTQVTLNGFGITNTAAGGIGLYSNRYSFLFFQNINFGPCSQAHNFCDVGTINCIGNYTISGVAQAHVSLSQGTFIQTPSYANTVTITGNPLFSIAYLVATNGGFFRANTSTTFSGTARGYRYSIAMKRLRQHERCRHQLPTGRCCRRHCYRRPVRMSSFPLDWYWLADDGRVYASARQAVVDKTDAGFVAREAEDGFTVTRWPVDAAGAQTTASLQAVLAPYGLNVDLTGYAAAARYAKETAGITVGTAQIATDRESQALITGMWAAAQIDPNISVAFKSSSGFVTINATQVAKIASAVAGYVQACFTAEGQVAAGIVAGTIKTTADVDAIIGAVKAPTS